jgi:hypothetical protein
MFKIPNIEYKLNKEITNEQLVAAETYYMTNTIFQIRDGRKRTFFITNKNPEKKPDGTIEFRECSMIDKTCFEKDGSYHGALLAGFKYFIFRDELGGDPEGWYSSVYDSKDIVEAGDEYEF